MPPDLKTLKAYVEKKALEPPTRHFVGGEDLVKINEIAKGIPENDVRERVLAIFKTNSKFSALRMILQDSSPLMQSHPELVESIVWAGCDMDYLYDHDPKAVF